MTHQKTTEIPWFFAFYEAKKVVSEPWMTSGVFAGLTRFELSSYDFEGKNKGYKGEFEENFSDSPFVIYVEVCGRVLSGLIIPASIIFSKQNRRTAVSFFFCLLFFFSAKRKVSRLFCFLERRWCDRIDMKHIGKGKKGVRNKKQPYDIDFYQAIEMCLKV